jgi:hypothetical protein
MAAKSSSSTSNKKTFGVRKKGKAQKTFNKHDRKSRKYRGQGR